MTALFIDHAPSDDELARLYWELAQLGAPSVGRKESWPYDPESPEALLALAGDMLRYDPRLLSILLQFVLEHWGALNPRELRACMTPMRWPQALLVVFEFAKLSTSDPELNWFLDYLLAGWRPMDPAERFFFDAERPGSRMAKRNAGRNLRPYARWGFVGTERPTSDVFTKRAVGSYDAYTRGLIRAELLKARGEVTLAEYLEALDHSVSRQQAYNDLRGDERLALTGHGRGARWYLTSRAAS